jgi:4a-hydroxytetrahydrobiopterin dehydratase
MDFTKKKCIPCETGEGKLPIEKIKEFMPAVEDWLLAGDNLVKEFKFNNFKESIKFINQVADLAESEGHHPDIFCFYDKVRLQLTTHAAHGLTENDFILAAKVNNLK